MKTSAPASIVALRSARFSTAISRPRALCVAAALLLQSGGLDGAELKKDRVAPDHGVPSTLEDVAGAGPLGNGPEFQRAWRERRSMWAKRVEQDRQAVVFLGAGHIQAWENGLPSAFPGMKVANRGIEGDTTRGVLSRIQDVLVLEPTAVVLLLGSGDLTQGASPEIAAGNLRLILEALQAARPAMPVVLCQVLPRPDARVPAEQIKALNDAFLEVVRNRPSVTLVESWAQFADAKGNATPHDFTEQGDLNDAGYKKLAAGLRPILSTLGVLREPPEQDKLEPGFVSLFNGRDLTGWGFRPASAADIEAAKRRDASSRRPPVRFYSDTPVQFDGQTVTPEGRYLARNRRLVVTTPPEYRKIQQLWTVQEFPEDFILRFEFRATPNADSGVYIRGPQLQVRDYIVAGPYNKLTRYRAQDWNEIEIRVTGTEAVCTCNGEVIEAKFQVPATGPIGFEGDRGQVEYRNIRIKTLP